MDSFAGSGTTRIAAEGLDRQWIRIENLSQSNGPQMPTRQAGGWHGGQDFAACRRNPRP